MAVLPTIKQRLDELDVDFQGTIFKKEIIRGWTVRTNSSGYKTAEYEVDFPVVMTNPLFGQSRWYSFDSEFAETFPGGVFTSPPTVSLTVTSENQNYVFQCIPKLPPSTGYTGSFFIIGMDTVAPTTVPPAKVHYIIHASGF